MICSHCGTDNKDEAIKCIQCGKSLKTHKENKKSGAVSRIRKISVGRSDGKYLNQLDDHTGPLPELNISDTIDLTEFHLEEVEIKEDVVDTDFIYESKDILYDEPLTEYTKPVDEKESRQSLSGYARPVNAKKPNKMMYWFTGIVSAAIIVAVIVLVYVAFFNKPEMSYADMILEGNKYYRQGAYEQAAELYTKALHTDDMEEESYFCLADTFTAMGDIEKAAAILSQGYEKTQSPQMKTLMEELIQPPETAAPETAAPETAVPETAAPESVQPFEIQSETVTEAQPAPEEQGVAEPES